MLILQCEVKYAVKEIMFEICIIMWYFQRKDVILSFVIKTSLQSECRNNKVLKLMFLIGNNTGSHLWCEKALTGMKLET